MGPWVGWLVGWLVAISIEESFLFTLVTLNQYETVKYRSFPLPFGVELVGRMLGVYPM